MCSLLLLLAGLAFAGLLLFELLLLLFELLLFLLSLNYAGLALAIVLHDCYFLLWRSLVVLVIYCAEACCCTDDAEECQREYNLFHNFWFFIKC